jgi:hypothetical protein
MMGGEPWLIFLSSGFSSRTYYAVSSLRGADMTVPSGPGSVFRGSPQSPPGSLPAVSEGEKAAWSETWRRTTRRARMKDILSGSSSAWSAASVIRFLIP